MADITLTSGIASAEAFGSLARIVSQPTVVGVSLITPITVSLDDAFTGLTVSEIVTTTVSLEEETI
jgi:phosphohistidine swiveling domain-containing protein